MASLHYEFGLRTMLRWLVPFWIAGVVLFHARNLVSLVGTRRLRHRGVCQAARDWQVRLAELRAAVQVSRTVVLLESSLATVPAVIGWLRPVIITPVGMLTALPTGQIEAILLHELAHVKRRDYLANLLQILVEGFLFYHPAVWWISGVIRAERENCCDDLVIATRGERLEYATALASLAEVRWPVTAMHATGGRLMQRIYRVLNPGRMTLTPLPAVIPAATLAIVTALAVGAWQVPPAQWNQWVKEDVAYIITGEERVAFGQLSSDAERELFVEQFWQRRDPTPGTEENEMKREHYRRIAYANLHYEVTGIPGWKSDRGRVYILYGPADEIESYLKAPIHELWHYRSIEGVGNNVLIEFEDKRGDGNYVITSDPH
jgi:GWxTD domain-containing protein